jgi:hypothetical protein
MIWKPFWVNVWQICHRGNKGERQGLLTPIGTWHSPLVMGLTRWPDLVVQDSCEFDVKTAVMHPCMHGVLAISNIRNSNSPPNLKRLHWMSWLVPTAFHFLHYYGSSFCGPVAEYMPTSPVFALTGQRLEGHAFVFRVYRSTSFFNTPHWMEPTKEWLSPLLNSFTEMTNLTFFFII